MAFRAERYRCPPLMVADYQGVRLHWKIWKSRYICIFWMVRIILYLLSRTYITTVWHGTAKSNYICIENDESWGNALASSTLAQLSFSVHMFRSLPHSPSQSWRALIPGRSSSQLPDRAVTQYNKIASFLPTAQQSSTHWFHHSISDHSLCRICSCRELITSNSHTTSHPSRSVSTSFSYNSELPYKNRDHEYSDSAPAD